VFYPPALGGYIDSGRLAAMVSPAA
jgi:hypothetical protein